jgi:hypothetical protein
MLRHWERAMITLSVKIQLRDPNHYPNHKQYPLKQDAKRGLQLILKGFLKHGLLESYQSSCNTPLLPVIRPTGEYRMIQDL